MSAHSLRPLYSTAVQHRCTGTGTVIPTGILLAVLLVSYGNKSQYHSSVSPRNKSLRTVTGMKSSPLPFQFSTLGVLRHISHPWSCGPLASHSESRAASLLLTPQHALHRQESWPGSSP